MRLGSNSVYRSSADGCVFGQIDGDLAEVRVNINGWRHHSLIFENTYDTSPGFCQRYAEEKGWPYPSTAPLSIEKAAQEARPVLMEFSPSTKSYDRLLVGRKPENVLPLDVMKSDLEGRMSGLPVLRTEGRPTYRDDSMNRTYTFEANARILSWWQNLSEADISSYRSGDIPDEAKRWLRDPIAEFLDFLSGYIDTERCIVQVFAFESSSMEQAYMDRYGNHAYPYEGYQSPGSSDDVDKVMSSNLGTTFLSPPAIDGSVVRVFAPLCHVSSTPAGGTVKSPAFVVGFGASVNGDLASLWSQRSNLVGVETRPVAIENLIGPELVDRHLKWVWRNNDTDVTLYSVPSSTFGEVTDVQSIVVSTPGGNNRYLNGVFYFNHTDSRINHLIHPKTDESSLTFRDVYGMRLERSTAPYFRYGGVGNTDETVGTTTMGWLESTTHSLMMPRGIVDVRLDDTRTNFISTESETRFDLTASKVRFQLLTQRVREYLLEVASDPDVPEQTRQKYQKAYDDSEALADAITYTTVYSVAVLPPSRQSILGTKLFVAAAENDIDLLSEVVDEESGRTVDDSIKVLDKARTKGQRIWSIAYQVDEGATAAELFSSTFVANIDDEWSILIEYVGDTPYATGSYEGGSLTLQPSEAAYLVARGKVDKDAELMSYLDSEGFPDAVINDFKDIGDSVLDEYKVNKIGKYDLKPKNFVDNYGYPKLDFTDPDEFARACLVLKGLQDDISNVTCSMFFASPASQANIGQGI